MYEVGGRKLGYLQSRVERFVFRRALEGIAVLFLPVVATGAVALSMAETAAVAASQFRYGGSPGAAALLFLHLFFAALFPSVVFAAALFFAAGRSENPGSGAAVSGLLAVAGPLFLWIFGTLRLGSEGAAAPLLPATIPSIGPAKAAATGNSPRTSDSTTKPPPWKRGGGFWCRGGRASRKGANFRKLRWRGLQ